MSTVPSGVLPLTASGPSARLPPVPAAHPARCSTNALRSAARAAIDLIARTFIPLPPVCPATGALADGAGFSHAMNVQQRQRPRNRLAIDENASTDPRLRPESPPRNPAV